MRTRTGLWAALLASCIVVAACADRTQVTTVVGDLMTDPAAPDFKGVGLHDRKTMTVGLQNVGRGRLDVLDFSLEGDAGTFSIVQPDSGTYPVIPGGAEKLTLAFAPLAAGTQAATLLVHTDSPAGREVRFTVKGTGIDARATLATHVLDFGKIEAQASETLPLKLSNTSPLPVVVTATVVGTDASEFSMQGLTLKPGEEANASVVWNPQTVGVKAAALAVVPCAGCDPELVSMTGEAIEQAVVAEPTSLDFGQVPVDFAVTQTVKLHNISTVLQHVTGVQPSPGSDVSFAPTPGQNAVVDLGPDVSAPFSATYTPGHLGPASGGLDFDVQSIRHPTTHVALSGVGGAPQLCISPLGYDFGVEPLNSKTVKTFNVLNCGANNGNPIVVNSIALEAGGNPDQYAIEPVATPVTLAAGQSVNINVDYEPTVAGPSTAIADLQTTLPSGPNTTQLHLQGNAQVFPPCDIVVTPLPTLDFGTLAPEHGGVLGVKIVNQGKEICVLKDVLISNDGGGAFKLPGGTLNSVQMLPNDYFTFEVSFDAPRAGGAVTGTLTIDPASSAQINVALKGNSQDVCLKAEPVFLDFGLASPQCPPHPLTVGLVNTCSKNVTISGVAIGSASTDNEFVIISQTPPAPVTLTPGNRTNVQAGFLAKTVGLNLAGLFATVQGSTAPPFLVPLIGELSGKDIITDNFTQQTANKVDVLFVVDNTESMIEEDPRIQSALPAFLNAAQSKGLDLHLATTTTGIDPGGAGCPGGVNGAEQGRFFPADNSSPRILTLTTPNLLTDLQYNTNVGRCNSEEDALEAARRALTPPLSTSLDDPYTAAPNDGNAGFLRDDAALAVLFIGDEDDHSPDDVPTYVKALQGVKGATQPDRTKLFAIAVNDTQCPTAGGTGTRYLEATQLSGGAWSSVCDADYSGMFQQVANFPFNPTATFYLTGKPQDGTITVSLNGAVQDGGWSYDPGTNSVTFEVTPPGGAKIAISYKRVCGG